MLSLLLLFLTSARSQPGRAPQFSRFLSVNAFSANRKASTGEVNVLAEEHGKAHRGKAHRALFGLYMLLFLAQILMCVLEIVRLSLARLGIGLLPFTFVTLIVAGALRLSHGFSQRIHGWRWANLAVWIALAVTNGVKIAEEVKEGTGKRKGSRYPESDEITDVSVMVGVYAALAVLEILLPP